MIIGYYAAVNRPSLRQLKNYRLRALTRLLRLAALARGKYLEIKKSE